METDKLKSAIESILFISGEPVSIARLAKITETDKPTVENALMVLQAEYDSARRGIVIIRKEDEVQMATNAENSEIVEQIIKSELQGELSRAALEVLSIVAYRGPISRLNIEAIRGVNSTFTLRNLLIRGLLEREENQKDSRSYLYQISFDFLKKLGLDNIGKLPDYETLSQDARVESIIQS
ncbi:MAG: SMC-Scp complex subunit ScpB [Candidatus Moranbacteria bacterium]|nr:SMC-Scp complex subunit ScpB [Candidatus Moranbacteria bacterium]